MNPATDTSTFTVPTSAVSHSPEPRHCRPVSSATSAEEHAVSTLMLGPSSPSRYDTLLEAMAALAPVAEYGLGWPRCGSEPYSPTWIPTNTPAALPSSSGFARPASTNAA